MNLEYREQREVMVNRLGQKTLLIVLVAVATVACQARADDYAAFDKFATDSWIDFFDGNDPHIYPANAAEAIDIDFSYPIAFSQAGGGDKAKGMNALKFMHGGRTEGHMVSRDLAGSFQILNTGDNNTFTTLLILVAVDAASLGDDFSLAMNMQGGPPCVLDVNDFGYYDNPHGRPSGYYSITDPNVDPIAYAFNTGMVTVYGVEGMPPLPPLSGSVTIDYAFNYLPGPAVFSVYGFIGTDPSPTIYHTNKALLDQNDPGGKKNSVSTFAVTVSGDLDGDLDVDLADLALLSKNWLTGTR